MKKSDALNVFTLFFKVWRIHRRCRKWDKYILVKLVNFHPKRAKQLIGSR